MEVPNQIGLEFLRQHKDNRRWADHLRDHWEEVLAQFSTGEYPVACQVISQTVRNRAHGDVSDYERPEILFLAMRIATAGLEWMNQFRDDGMPLCDRPSCGMDYGNLCMMRGNILIQLNQPIQAIAMFE